MQKSSPKIRKRKCWPYEVEEVFETRADFWQELDIEELVPGWVRVDREAPKPAITIEAGYRFDGPSVPWPIRKLVEHQEKALGPSLLHDVLYQAGRIHQLDEAAYREEADARFLRDLRDAGMPWPWPRLYYWGVRLAGKRHFTAEAETYYG